MSLTGHEDRLQRLRQRGKALFKNLERISEAQKQLMRHAWDEALEATGGANTGTEDASHAAIKVSRLDAILSLLERLTRPAQWLDEQATWFNMAECCLLDAATHVGNDVPVPSPILAVEPIDSPLYVPRARVPGAWLAQATPADLPLPVVLCPGNLLEEPWEWATLFHELGHHLDSARGDTRSLLVALKEEEKRVDLGSWSSERWLGELIADLYAGLVGGPGAVDTLKAALSTRECSASHPADVDRAAILDAAWTCVRDGRRPSGNRPTEIVTRALVDRFQSWQPRLQSDCAKPEEPLDSARLLPGLLRRRQNMTPEALRKACREAFEHGSINRPPWMPTEAHLKTLATAMRNLVETRVQPGSDTLKIPPIELLIRHDRISFVGATHGQLLAKLQEAMKYRKSPYEHIELFALEDAPLRELLVGNQTGDSLIQERDKSLRDLREYLNRLNVPHRIYLYTQPYIFASFWDVEPPKARPDFPRPVHIHVSSALWGMDLRHAAAQDLEAPADEPLPSTMQRWVEALTHLRKMSRELT